jgi:hypothetical protein
MEKRKFVSLFAAASFVLSLTSLSFAADSTQESGDVDLRSGGGSEAAVLIVGDGLSNNAANPDIDTWLIKCKGKTTICADVNPFGTFNDNTVHVSIICIAPLIRRGFGELEYGIDGAVSDSACVADCTEAVVSFQCEFHDACDENYDTVMTCVGKNFVPNFPKRRT